MAQKGHAQRHFLDGHPDANAPGEQLMLAGRLAVCGFWDMRPAFSTHLSVH